MSSSPDVVLHYAMVARFVMLLAIGSLGLCAAFMVHLLRTWLERPHSPPEPLRQERRT